MKHEFFTFAPTCRYSKKNRVKKVQKIEGLLLTLVEGSRRSIFTVIMGDEGIEAVDNHFLVRRHHFYHFWTQIQSLFSPFFYFLKVATN